MDKIVSIDNLIDKVSNLEIPQSLKNLNDLDNIMLLSEEIETTVNNIFGDLEYENLAQRIIAFFKSGTNPYTNNQKESRIQDWKSGKAKTLTLLDNIKTNLQQQLNSTNLKDGQEYIDLNLISDLKSVKNSDFDLKKLIKFCEEINNNYEIQNYLSCILILRALINHIPPIFGYETFAQVVSQSSRSLKEHFTLLDNGLRKVADSHTHTLIKKNESLPSKNQIEPYKPQLEFLLQEIYNKTK
jgi:hypothetical protein